jgi:hypothetical protein
MSNDKQLARFDSNQILDILSRMPSLTEQDRRDLAMRMASDDADMRKLALEKMTQSTIAQGDLAMLQGELAAMSKEKIVFNTTQKIKTGSGTIDIHIKGGDTKLIIPVLVILGIVVLVGLFLIFWK